jgi:hypothetical protein
MICDNINFVSMEKYEGGVVIFGDDKASIISGRGSISLDGKHNTDDVLYVEGLKHNILSVGQIVDKGYDLQFKNGKCRILSGSRSMITPGTKTKGNIFHLNIGANFFLIDQVDESWLWHRRLCHVNFDKIFKIISTQVVRIYLI